MGEWSCLLLAYGFSVFVGGLFVRLTAKQLYRSLSLEAVDEHEALVRLTSLVGFLERMLYTYFWFNRVHILIGLWLLAKVIGRHGRPEGPPSAERSGARETVPPRARFNISLVNSALSLIFGIGGAVILGNLRRGDFGGAAFRAGVFCLAGLGAWLWAWLSPKIAGKPTA